MLRRDPSWVLRFIAWAMRRASFVYQCWLACIESIASMLALNRRVTSVRSGLDQSPSM
jgi:hypothetical protein